MSKYLLLYHHPDINYLTEEYISGLCWKSINRWARARVGSSGSGIVKNMFIGEQMISTISCSHDKQAAIKYTSDELLIKDLKGNRRPHLHMLKILKRMEEKHFPKDGSSWFNQILAYVKTEHNNQKDDRLAQRLGETYQQHKSVLVKLAHKMKNWNPVKNKYVLQFPSVNVHSDIRKTYLYLQRLKDRKHDGDDDRRADLVELGWTFDDNERDIAQMSKLLSENESNAQAGQETADEWSRLKGLQNNDGNVEVHEEEQPDTLFDFMAGAGL